MSANGGLKLGKRKILFLCTGNSCRSQMAEGFAHQMGWDAYSAGTKPEIDVNPFAIKVMSEIDIDISNHIPQSVNEYLDENFNIIATVCDNARETCPIFSGSSDHQIHHGFEDPAEANGSDGEITEVYRRIRDEIQDWVKELMGGNL